jgi:cytochrome d ubiquinol oxidase subunit II
MATFLGIDYPTLWFLLIGAVFSGYAILDGFDLGVGAIHLFLRKEESRRIALNAIGPVWDGNEVWIVIGGGALFAGFPKIYATLLSVLYVPFMLFLVALIFRAIAIEFRSKEPMQWWRRMWDVCFCVSSIAVALLLGLILGNVLQGLPIDAQGELQERHRASFSVLNPYALIVAATTLALFMMHGALYLVMKTEHRLYARLTFIVKNTVIAFVLCYAVLTLYTLLYLPHLSDRFRSTPALFAIPLVSILAVANITRLVAAKRYALAFFSSSVVISSLFVLVAVEVYPNVVLSSLNVQHHLSIYNAASSDTSLGIMLLFAAIGIPLVASYTLFVFRTFRGKVQLDEHSY